MPWKWNAETEGQYKSSFLFKTKWYIKVLFIKKKMGDKFFIF